MKYFLLSVAVCIEAWETQAFSVGHGRILLGKHASQQESSFPVLLGERFMKPLYMAKVPDLDSNDPFAILGLDPNDQDSLDKKVIKRAYKRAALKYHPDVATNRDSTSEEKKTASDQFAKINAAYETLMGKREGSFASSSSSSASTSGANGWTPPHRRKPGESSYSSSYSSSGSGTSWEDFMPKYDDDQYDAGGDSFGAIFADLLAGAAGTVGSRGGAGVFQDFVEFLEQTVDGYGGVSGGTRAGDEDADLAFLLQTGSVDEVGEELDETELVVQQLTTKLTDLEDEILMIQTDLAASTRFSEKIALEEREAECKARKSVVENYLRKARKRLLALQTRYKQLIVGGANDNKAGGRGSDRTWGSDAGTRSTYSRSTGAGGSYSRRASSSDDPEDAWKTEGFGSSGRGRGSRRRRTSRSYQSSEQSTSRTSQRSSEQSTSSTSASSSPYRSTYSSGARTDSVSSPRANSRQSSESTNDYNVPPHRRSGSYQAQDDRERLRQLKVDDEMERLKKELGL